MCIDKQVEGVFMASKVMMVVALIFVCWGSGCGIYDRHVHLVSNQAMAGVHSDRGGSIYVEMPSCPRLIKKGKKSHVLGEIDIGGSPNAGSMLTTDSVPEWLADALCMELRVAGFTPQLVEKLPLTADHGIATYLVKVWLDGAAFTRFSAVDATADLHLRMTLYRRGEVVKEFDAKGTGCGEPQESLTIALENCMRKAVPIIVAGLNE